MSYRGLLDDILHGHHLNEEDAHHVMGDALGGELGDARLAALLAALRAKGPHPDELVGFAQAMRERSARINVAGPLLDTCGTGGAAVKTFNISTAAAFVVAADGVRVAKHGNRSVTRPSGSADVLERAGARLDLDPDQCARILQEVGIAFLFAPAFHPAMRHAGPVRQQLGIKTVFNLLGPLTNPAGAEGQVLGVAEPGLVPIMAEALARLGCRTGYVLHGRPGSDEATPCGPVQALPIEGGRPGGELHIDPGALGLPACAPADIAPVEAARAPALLRAILAGHEQGPRADTVALNAAFGLRAAGRVEDLQAGVERARELLLSGAGMAKWDAFIEATQSVG